MVEGGSNRHFPLLAPGAAVEQQRAEIGQTVRQGHHADNGHDEMEDLQHERVGEIAKRFEKGGGQNEEHRLDGTGQRFAVEGRQEVVDQAAAENRQQKQQQRIAELPQQEGGIAPTGFGFPG